MKSHLRCISFNQVNINILDGKLNYQDEDYIENSNAMKEIINDLYNKIEKVNLGGSEKAVKLHHSRNFDSEICGVSLYYRITNFRFAK